MHSGDIVFFPIKQGFIKYIIKNVIDDELFVISFRSKRTNCIDLKDVIKYDDFIKIYKNEQIFE